MFGIVLLVPAADFMESDELELSRYILIGDYFIIFVMF